MPNSAIYWNKVCYSKSLGTFPGDTAWQGISLGSIGGVYYDQKKYDDALTYFLKSTGIINSLKLLTLSDFCVNAYSDIAKIYIYKGDYPKANEYLNRAKKSIDKDVNTTSLLHYYNSLVDFYKTTGSDHQNLLKSLDSQEKFKSIVEAELDVKQKFSAEAEIQYNKQVTQTELAKQKIRETKLAFYGTLFILLLTAALAVLYIKRRNLQFKLQEQKTIREKKKSYEELLSAKKQLNDFSKNLIDKNKLIEQFAGEIEQLKLHSQEKANEKEDMVARLKQSVILTEDDWQGYKSLFDKAYPKFIAHLKEQYPNITSAEMRYLMFSKLQLSNKEMAALLGISTEAIRNLKFRVKQKTGFTEANEFLQSR